MLALAKLDREPEVCHDHVDLGALARDVAVDSTASHDGLTLDVIAGSEPVVVSGDEDLLRQALANLVSNAAIHAGPNATTTLTVFATGARARVEVRDDGAGMSADAVGRATERFYRADPSRSRERGGSGLGLAIVAGIVAAHDGDLSIESTPDVGTIVSMEIPLAVGLEDSQPTPS
jgi:two-component system OmpR family sensor kinase